MWGRPSCDFREHSYLVLNEKILFLIVQILPTLSNNYMNSKENKQTNKERRLSKQEFAPDTKEITEDKWICRDLFVFVFFVPWVSLWVKEINVCCKWRVPLTGSTLYQLTEERDEKRVSLAWLNWQKAAEHCSRKCKRPIIQPDQKSIATLLKEGKKSQQRTKGTLCNIKSHNGML